MPRQMLPGGASYLCTFSMALLALNLGRVHPARNMNLRFVMPVCKHRVDFRHQSRASVPKTASL